MSEVSGRGTTRTGGRAASGAVVPGRYALSVGMPDRPTPEGWRWTLLSDIARLESGHTPSRKHPEYWDGDIPWVGIKDATKNHGRTISDTLQHTNELGIANSSARLLPENTVCLSRTASVGYVVVMGRPMATSQDFVNWVCSEALDFRYLKYVLLAENETFLSFASGTTHQTIYFPEVKAFYICLPPIETQQRIAEVLSAYDQLIENNTRRIENLEEMAQTLYREWFVEFRYPGHEAAQLVESDLGSIPEGWKARSLGGVSENFDRLRKPLSKMKRAEMQGPFPYYGAAKIFDFVDGYIFDGTYLLVAEDGSVMTTEGFPVLQYVTGKFWANNHTHILAGAGVSTEYLYLALSRFAIGGYITGAAQPKVTQRNLNRIPVLQAPAEIAKPFDELVGPTFQLMRALEMANALLYAARDLLLPRLIAGEIDVSDFDIDLGDAAA